MRFFLLIIILLNGSTALCQRSFIRIKGLSTEEVYDIYADKKGFIWVAHSLGVSRYDGHQFTNFESPDQSPLAVTNLCEDKEGRIWFHNFNGKVFYIENEIMHVFSEYSDSNQNKYPTLTILDSNLIITSSRGIFVCNTKTLKGRFLNIEKGNATSLSLSIIGNSVITFNWYEAYKYVNGKPIKKLFISNITNNNTKHLITGFTLAPIRTKDTLYAYNHDKLYKLIERDDTLKIISIKTVNGLINTITNDNGHIWVNTKKLSFQENSNSIIYNKNLTNVVTDINGNIWYSSLQQGLLLDSKYKGWKNTVLPFLARKDFIRCMIVDKDREIFGTQNGQVIIVRKGKVMLKITLPSNVGSIEHIFLMPNKNLVIAPSLALYFENIEANRLYKLADNGTVKDWNFTDSTILIARSSVLIKMKISEDIKKLFFFFNTPLRIEQRIINYLKKSINSDITVVAKSRCYVVNTDLDEKSTFAIFKNGVAEIINDSVKYILSSNKEIQASNLIQKDGILYIGTSNSGIIIYKKIILKNISVKNGLFDNTILKMKMYNNQLYLIEPKVLQIWDVRKNIFVTTIPLPIENDGTVYDFFEKNHKLYLTYSNSIFQVDLSAIDLTIPANYLILAKASISNTLLKNNSALKYNDNNIEIILSSPAYIHPEATYFMYSLKGSYDTTWKKINGPLYSISFESLKPGKYIFEAYAINFQNRKSNNKVLITFVIEHPWWQEWWFYLLTFMFFCFIGGLILLLRFNRVKKENQLVVDKLTLQNDLRKSLLRTLIAQMNPHFIFNAMNTIQTFVYRNDKRSVSNYLGKFSELIRKILDTSNIDSITLEEEIEILKLYIDLEKVRFEESFQIQLTVEKDLETELIKIPTMFIQPYVENAIKHGLFHKKGQKDLLINIEKVKEKKGYIKIIINDNGIGRNRSFEINYNLKSKHKSFASSAMQNRIELINQTLENKITLNILDKPKDSGTIVIIELPILN